MDEIITRKCKKCGAKFSGRRCKACKAAWWKKHCAAHRDETNTYNRKYFAKHPDKKSTYNRKYHVKNRDKTNAYSRKYRIEYPEKVSAIQRKCKLLREYGITMEDYDKMFMTQHGKCAICGSLPNSKRLSIDHDHNTGKVRGLLCVKCNSMLSYAQDDVAILAKAQDYLNGGN
uniref:Putative recombination endonuclease VII n=1 Tax=viral metagenome TaxID=1070528 RepID=A0A6H1ZAQ2_9ZZZZ